MNKKSFFLSIASSLASLWNKDFKPLCLPIISCGPHQCAPLSTVPASGRKVAREGKFLNVGCIKIWYNQKIISSHLAIKDCRTLESFEEFASNGCLAMRKRNFAAGNTSSVFSSISFIFILLDYAPRRLHLKTKCAKFFSKVKEWPLFGFHCRVAGDVMWWIEVPCSTLII